MNASFMYCLFYVQGSENAQASIFTGEEELFAFQRAISRIKEMQTESYWQLQEDSRSSNQVLLTKGEKTIHLTS